MGISALPRAGGGIKLL